jgi:zinc D-Ala-D-Ala carboxypeptidase
LIAQWEKYTNFSKHEFTCKHTGRNEMQHEFMEKLQALRTEYGKSITISSGYRDPTHPVERGKTVSGAHTSGLACDIACSGSEAYKILELAFKHGFNRIGVHQRGAMRFIHLDIVKKSNFPSPYVWSY